MLTVRGDTPYSSIEFQFTEAPSLGEDHRTVANQTNEDREFSRRKVVLRPKGMRLHTFAVDGTFGYSICN